MTGFRFRLQRVLGWYREQCRFEESRVASCLAEVTAARMVLAQLQAERVAIEREIVSRPAIAAADLRAWGLYRLRSHRQESDLQVDLDRRERALREQRARLLAARRRLQLMEKLRDRRLAEYVHRAGMETECLAADVYLAAWSREQAAHTARPD
jgi:hypothetical protein